MSGWLTKSNASCLSLFVSQLMLKSFTVCSWQQISHSVQTYVKGMKNIDMLRGCMYKEHKKGSNWSTAHCMIHTAALYWHLVVLLSLTFSKRWWQWWWWNDCGVQSCNDSRTSCLSSAHCSKQYSINKYSNTQMREIFVRAATWSQAKVKWTTRSWSLIHLNALSDINVYFVKGQDQMTDESYSCYFFEYCTLVCRNKLEINWLYLTLVQHVLLSTHPWHCLSVHLGHHFMELDS